MRFALVALLLVGPLFGAPGQFPKDWPANATFPAQPKVEVSVVPNLTYSGKASLVFAGQSYVIYRFVFPVGTHLDRERGDAIVKGMFMTNQNRVLERAEDIKIADIPARRLVIADFSMGGVLEIRVLFIQNEQYLFMYQRPIGREPSLESDTFFAGIKVGPNHSPDPTPASVTPTAGQPPSQP
jgi:hypothetical protein